MTRDEMLADTKRLAIQHQEHSAEWRRIALSCLAKGDLYGAHSARWKSASCARMARNYLDCVLSGQVADGVLYGYAYGFNGHADRV